MSARKYGTFQAFAKIVCNSLYLRESILRAYGLGAEVCYCGLDELISHPDAEALGRPFF